MRYPFPLLAFASLLVCYSAPLFFRFSFSFFFVSKQALHRETNTIGQSLRERVQRWRIKCSLNIFFVLVSTQRERQRVMKIRLLCLNRVLLLNDKRFFFLIFQLVAIYCVLWMSQFCFTSNNVSSTEFLCFVLQHLFVLIFSYYRYFSYKCETIGLWEGFFFSFFLNSSFTVLCISQVFGLETKSLTSSYILSLLRNTAVFILNIKGISCALLFRICLIRHFCVGLPYCWCSLHFWLI